MQLLQRMLRMSDPYQAARFSYTFFCKKLGSAVHITGMSLIA
jgi:hypothetical protein